MNSRENHDQLTLQQIQMFKLSICFAENFISVKMHTSNWLKLIIFFILAMEFGFTDSNLMTKFCSEKHMATRFICFFLSLVLKNLFLNELLSFYSLISHYD